MLVWGGTGLCAKHIIVLLTIREIYQMPTSQFLLKIPTATLIKWNGVN